MKFSVTLVFFLLFMVVAYCYIHFTPVDAVKVADTAALVRVLPLEEGDHVIGIRIRHKEGGLLHLEKKGQEWVIESPFQDTADGAAVEGLVAALTLSAKARRLIPDKGWEEFGLKDPELAIGVRSGKRPEWRALAFGDTAPVGDYVYARWEGENEYFLVDSNVKRAFERGNDAYRQRKIFSLPLAEIRKIRMQYGLSAYELTRRGEDWLWTEPVELLGNSLSRESEGALIAELGNLYIKEFVEGPKARTARDMGLMDPKGNLTLWAGGEKPAATLVLGEEILEKDALYASRREDETVFLVSRSKMLHLFNMLVSLASAGT